MGKRLTTIEISRLSGVSRGTVDRILHNRGKVSEDAINKVNAVLGENRYKYNLHTSAISFKKDFRLGVCLPDCSLPFWKQVLDGIRYAVEEYSDINIKVNILDTDPFDGQSQIVKVREAVEEGIDAMILAPLFKNESPEICRILKQSNVPYAFVNTLIEDAEPISVLTIDHYASGVLAAKLSDWITDKSRSICVCYADRNLDPTDIEMRDRLSGIQDYFDNGSRSAYPFNLDIQHTDRMKKRLTDFLGWHPEIGGIVVTNAFGSEVAKLLSDTPYKEYPIVSYDLTDENRACLEDKSIAVVICQKPQAQGYKATESLLEYFLYKTVGQERIDYLPIDIIMPDNLPYYRDLE